MLKNLKVDKIGDGANFLANSIRTYHLAGHSPDCFAVLLETRQLSGVIWCFPIFLPGPRAKRYLLKSDIIKPEYTDKEGHFWVATVYQIFKKNRRDCPSITQK